MVVRDAAGYTSPAASANSANPEFPWIPNISKKARDIQRHQQNLKKYNTKKVVVKNLSRQNERACVPSEVPP